MAIVVRSVQNFFARFFKRETEENQAGKIEVYLGVLYKLLIWEDPLLSGLAFFSTHILFWLILYFELRLYGIFFLVVLILILIDTKFGDIQAQTNKSISLNHIRQTVNIISRFFYYLTTLRSEHPGLFCICMCTGFLALSILGRTLSGLLLAYFGVLSILLIPGIISRLPPDVLNSVRQTLHTISTDEGVIGENDLIPSGQECGWYDKEIDCESMKTDKTLDSCTNSFISGVTSMPSYLEAEGSLDDLDEVFDFVSREVSRTKASADVSSDSSDGENSGIEFESSHFNRDSSSEEDSNYTQGLAFSELDATPDKTVSLTQQLGSELINNLGNVGSLVSKVLRAASTTKRNDSDSDFEIINSEEMYES